jgi:hypothetical protein
MPRKSSNMSRESTPQHPKSALFTKDFRPGVRTRNGV